MQPVSIDVKCLNLWQNYNCNCHGCIQLFSYCIWGWLLNFFRVSLFLKSACLYRFLKSISYNAFVSTSVSPPCWRTLRCFCPCNSVLYRLLASISFMPYLVLRERKNEKHDEPKTNIYMYKVMYTIYSNTFQNRQTLKSLAKISIYFFSQPIR